VNLGQKSAELILHLKNTDFEAMARYAVGDGSHDEKRAYLKSLDASELAVLVGISAVVGFSPHVINLLQELAQTKLVAELTQAQHRLLEKG
jgi:hypothetical protein